MFDFDCDCNGLEPKFALNRPSEVGLEGKEAAGGGGFERLGPSDAKGVGAILSVKEVLVDGCDAESNVGFGVAKNGFVGALELAVVGNKEGLLVVSFCCDGS